MSNDVELKPGQCHAGKDPKEVIIVRSIGAGIAMVVYDCANHVGGAAHFILPSPSKDESKAEAHPKTGVPVLLKKMKELGADLSSLSVKIVGGAGVAANPLFSFGKKIRDAAVEAIQANGLAIDKEATGGNLPRNLKFYIGTGKIELETMAY
ncbi:MAG: chemotaxis protein CheD [Nitrospinae bacterium]|nr:chemotaxis protein CheD [Nitrospinota bacterium]